MVAAMPTQHYFFKLIAPRPTFPQDMTEQERQLMAEHGKYCQEHFERGKLLLFGPVMASEGAFGIGVLQVESEEEARQFGEGDPSVRGGMNKFEIHPMKVSAARGI